MSLRIGLISDIHASVAPLREALLILERERVDMVICAGDIAGYGSDLDQCVELLAENGCTTIMGNHEIWYLDSKGPDQHSGVNEYFHNLPLKWEATVEGKRILVVHASPPNSMNRGITILDQYESKMPAAKEGWTRELAGYDLDVLIVGHTHQVFAEVLGQTLVINPGSTKFNHSCAILDLPGLDVRFFSLSEKTIRKVWHWGSELIQENPDRA